MRKEFVEFIKKNEKTKETSLKAILQVMAVRLAEEDNDKSYVSKFIKGSEKEYFAGCGYALEDSDKANQLYEELLSHIKDIDTSDIDNALNVLPFYTFAETNLGKKEHYQDISVRFNALTKKLFAKKPENKDIAKYLFAVVTANEYMSEQIFEYHMALTDMFKACFKKYSKGLLNADKEDRILIAYALFRACKMKVMLEEKYQDIIEELLA